MKLKNALILLLTATIWGVAFVAQSVGGSVGTYTFNCIRSVLAVIVLLITSKVLKVKFKKEGYIPGFICGIVLFLAMTFQQYGVVMSTVGKAGFITALYILLVPIIYFIIYHKISKNVIIGVMLGVIGLYFLCINEALTIQTGDFLLILCALFFSLHIIVIDKFVKDIDALQLSTLQFLTVAIISFILMIFFEKPDMVAIQSNALPILYAGVCSSGIAYTLQMIGQKDMDPSISSLILSLESSISLIAGMIILSEFPTSREWIGCICMFSAIMIAQKE